MGEVHPEDGVDEEQQQQQRAHRHERGEGLDERVEQQAQRVHVLNDADDTRHPDEAEHHRQLDDPLDLVCAGGEGDAVDDHLG